MVLDKLHIFLSKIYKKKTERPEETFLVAVSLILNVAHREKSVVINQTGKNVAA